MVKRIIIALCTLAVLSTPAIAGVNLNFDIQVAPPPPQVEVVPAPRSGYVWAPGYWAWEGGRHVWVGGHWVPVRRGYYWVPDRWVEYRGPRGPRWHLEPGHWEREHWHRHY
jgi:hypothetical protein